MDAHRRHWDNSMGLRVMLLLCVAALLCATEPVVAQEYATIDKPANSVPLSKTIAKAAENDSDESPISNGEIEAVLAEAEALYATGVVANLDQRYHDAQISFEQAITLLGELEPVIGEDQHTLQAIERLLEEIATDYRQTLIALGELDSEASISAVLLRFDASSYDGEELKEAPSVEAPAEDAPVEYNFPIEMNDKVRNCLVYYQTVAREPLERFLVRAGRYLPMMKEIVASYGLPTDIAYLPLVESGFNSKAYSYAHAAGPWQFISSTGRKYGLNRTWWYDERRDFEKSTHAACQYLKDLYEMFDSWPLAFAAYNGGEGRVGRQIKRQGTRDFWKLRLHRQTRNYVPLFMASLLIAKDPERYGFHVEPDPPLEFEWVATSKPIELKDVARAIGCSLDALTELNPELRRLVTPPDVKPYRFRVPMGLKETFADVYKSLPASERTEWVRHTVGRGETVGALARRYGVQTSDIVRANKLSNAHRISVGQTLTIPVPMAYADNLPAPEEPTTRRRSPSSSSDSKYTVRRGDSLWKLAKKFGTTTSAIRRANNMGQSSPLIAGTTIIIPGRGNSGGNSVMYTIRRGDTMSRIAQRFGVTVGQILGANSLSDPDRIRVGQRIRIPQGM